MVLFIENVYFSNNVDKVHVRMGFLEDMILHFFIAIAISVIRAV